jgi:sterol desaturase/sphingolipid hydroxylase (fatty acid hydroxylase superfamily)
MESRKPKFKSNNDGEARMFENKFLDSLTKTHIAIPVAIFLVYAIALLYRTYLNTDIGFLTVAFVFFSGAFLFTFAEYAIHRWVYHPPHDASEGYKEITYKIHGLHHDYPKDKQRLAMPPLLAIIIATLLLFVFEMILNQYGDAFAAGFVTGYALYLLIHYSIHMYSPPKNVFKILWVNHSIHHYSEDEILFGVSNPLWDYIFRTTPRSNRDQKMAKEIYR